MATIKSGALSEPRTLLTGLAFGESPRWRDGRLWVCDWGAQEVIAARLDGTREIVARVSSFPFCIDWDRTGRLLVVSASERRLLRQDSDGSLTPYAELGALSQKPWNEIVVDSRGNAYVNNIGFDFGVGEVGPGMIALVAPDGSSRQVAGDVAFPNGMVVTPDNATLIVAESYASKLTAFDIAPDGALVRRRVWADLHGGAPDGICLDADGAVWYADVPNKHCVRVREGGEVLQTIEVDRGCFACMLGGATGRTLFIVAREWNGPASLSDRDRTGEVLMVEAPAARAGRP